jgi:hypothetical protein
MNKLLIKFINVVFMFSLVSGNNTTTSFSDKVLTKIRSDARSNEIIVFPPYNNCYVKPNDLSLFNSDRDSLIDGFSVVDYSCNPSLGDFSHQIILLGGKDGNVLKEPDYDIELESGIEYNFKSPINGQLTIETQVSVNSNMGAAAGSAIAFPDIKEIFVGLLIPSLYSMLLDISKAVIFQTQAVIKGTLVLEVTHGSDVKTTDVLITGKGYGASFPLPPFTQTNQVDNDVYTLELSIPVQTNENITIRVGQKTNSKVFGWATAYWNPANKFSNTVDYIRLIEEKSPEKIASSSTVFLIDTSGSMNEEDITGYSKIEAAQRATRSILDVIKTENMSGLSYLHQVGLVSFENTATLGVDLTTDLTSVESGIDRLYALGGTGMADGLRLAIDMLSPVDPTYNKMTILLSDGMPNVGLNSNNYLTEYEIIDELINLASEAKSTGICVHTIGFGLPGQIGGVSGQASINEDLLRQIASGSGCGNYYNASNAIELANAFIEIRHASLGQILLNQEGVISQNETLDLGSVPVVDDQELILITLNWPGSQLDLELTDPAGVIVDSNYPNASINASSSIVSMAVAEPMAGNWRVKVFGADVPEPQTDYKVLFSARAKPELPVVPAVIQTDNVIQPPSGLTAILVVVLIAASAVLVTKYSGSKKKGPAVNPPSQACLISQPSSAQQIMIPLTKNFVIGRRSTANLHLDSIDISRDHAQIYCSGGKWYIHDMNSHIGTFVNGHAIKIAPLSSGDRIKIGKEEWIFHITP